MFRTKALLLLSLLLPGLVTNCFAQVAKKNNFVFEGLVYGYKYDPSRGLLKKEKQIVIEGILERVSFRLTDNSGKQVATCSSNAKGEFRLEMLSGVQYRLELTRNGYQKSVMMIDLRQVPADVAAPGITFTGAEMVLNSFRQKDTTEANLPFGKLFYNTQKKYIDLEANAAKKGGLFSKNDENNTSVSLMRRSVTKNMLAVKTVPTKNGGTATTSSGKGITNGPEENPEENTGTEPVAKESFGGLMFKTKVGLDKLKEDKIAGREQEIAEARRKLEEAKKKAASPEDSVQIGRWEMLLEAAEQELGNAKEIIGLQKSELKAQRNLLYLAVFCVLLLIGISFLIYRNSRERKAANLLLESRNKKITDSINYASRIQRSILLPEAEIRKMLPGSFIFYQPRDIVSGDFYWFSTIGDKVIVAAVDCTGHGVPGAFMSLIGNTLLNEIVNEKHITEPASILNLLHRAVLRALRQQEGEDSSQDGMEMSLCVIDKKQKKLCFSGAANPIYLVASDGLRIIKGDHFSIGGLSSYTRKNQKVEFTEQEIAIEKGMSLYMFSDGYIDQFGGPANEKFNSSRFRDLLLSMKGKDMDSQRAEIDRVIHEWKQGQKQIDDMLVIGIDLNA